MTPQKITGLEALKNSANDLLRNLERSGDLLDDQDDMHELASTVEAIEWLAECAAESLAKARKDRDNANYWRTGGPLGPTGHGDICYSDSDF